MCQGGVFEVGVDLFDDGVSAVGLVAATVSRSPVVKKAWKRQVSNKLCWPSPAEGLRSGMRRTTSLPWICSAAFRELNALNPISATSAREIHW